MTDTAMPPLYDEERGLRELARHRLRRDALDSAKVEELAQLIVSATWQAAWQTAVSLGRAAAGLPDADKGDSDG
jgi:hypothetical protein